jgi:Phytanoyl-CoA dioxygenase (PhyH)
MAVGNSCGEGMWPRKIVAGTGEIIVDAMKEFHLGVEELGDRRHELTASFRKDGYLLLRNFLPDNECLKCRAEIIKHLISRGLAGDVTLEIPEQFQTANSNPYCNRVTSEVSPNLMSYQEWINENEHISSYLSHPNLDTLFKMLLEDTFGSTMTCQLPFKWLRAVGTGLFTGLHCDNVYVGHISSNILTAWIPLGDVSTKKGALFVASGSHNNELWKPIREEYSNGTVGGDGTSSGWITTNPNDMNGALNVDERAQNPFGWVSTDFGPGDVCILNLQTIHMTATNVTDKWRLSCDARWAGM